MTLRSDARDAGVLVRTELRARIRHILGSVRQTLSVALLALMFGVAFPLMGLVPVLGFGERLAGPSVPLGELGAVLAAVAGVGAYLGSASAIQQNRLGSVGPLVRTSVPPTAVVLGRFASEAVQAGAFVVPIGTALLAIVSVGAGSPFPALLIALAATPALISTIVLGRLLGDVLRYLKQRLRISTWTKALLLVGGSAVAFLGTQTVMRSALPAGSESLSPAIPAFLPGTPLQAYAGVVFSPIGASVRPFGAVVTGLVLASVPVGLWATLRFEEWLLLREPAADRDETARADVTRAVPRLLRLTPSTRVAWRYLLRTRRDPAMLAHLFPVLIGAMSFLASFLGDPELALQLGPDAAVVAGAAFAGGAYCLNPLGDDRDQLPLLLTSTDSAAVLLRGRALAGLVIGLVLAVGVGAPLGLATDSVVPVLARSAFAVVLLAAAAGTALGMGAILPKFERSEYVNVERAHPSMLVVVGYFLGTVVVGIVGLLALAGVLGDPTVVHWAVAVVFAVVVGATGLGGYLYAVRRFDRLTLDDV